MGKERNEKKRGWNPRGSIVINKRSLKVIKPHSNETAENHNNQQQKEIKFSIVWGGENKGRIVTRKENGCSNEN